MEFVRRGTTKRNASNAIAITNGLEGSKVVLDALERTKSDKDIAFLKPAAESAIAILYSIRAIREGEVDDDFAGLALDACGLVFILINECYKILQVSDQIPERFTWGSDELAAYLRDDVYVFVQKKIKRGFLKKHLKQMADDEKVVTSRDTLRKWTTKLEIQTGPSIHDTVETIISEKVSKHDQDAQAIRYARDADKLRQPQEQNQSSVQRLTNSPSTTHSTPDESIMQPSAKAEKPLPEIKITDSTESEDKSGNAILVESQAIGNGLELTPFSEKENDMRQRTKEMERQAKREEREKWMRSEQEFSRLPHIPIQEDTPSPGMRRSAEDLRPGPSGESTFSQGNRNQTSVYDEKRDLEVADTPNESTMQPSAKAEKLLPEIKIIDSTESEDKSGNGVLVESQAIGNGLELTPFSEKENDMRQITKEMERQAKREEREKWRRSEQEFSRLPYIRIQEDTPSPGMRRSAEDLRPGPSGESTFSQGNRNRTSVYDEKRDLEVAAELQAKLAREVEEEDEQKALAIAIALHRQWEAEPEVAAASQAGQLRSSVQNRKHSTADVDPESNNIYPWNKADRRRSGSSIAAFLDESPSLKAI